MKKVIDLGLDKNEIRALKKLNTPQKIQDFIDTLKYNFEEDGETYMSPRRVLKEGKAHCLEGALLSATALWLNGEKPLLLDLKAPGDIDHVVCLYQRNGCWGAISKTNHAVLRHRDPVYKTLRELVLSYFHEYFLDKTGKKTLRSFSEPLDLRQIGIQWITAEEELWDIPWLLERSKHFKLFSTKTEKLLRKADHMERRAGQIVEWKKAKK